LYFVAQYLNNSNW